MHQMIKFLLLFKSEQVLFESIQHYSNFEYHIVFYYNYRVHEIDDTINTYFNYNNAIKGY